MQSVPFEIEQSGPGLSRSRGVVYVEGEELVFEVQTTLVGFIERRPKAYRFDLVDLESVRYKKGFRQDRLTLRTRPLGIIAAIPGAAQGELCLVFKRACRDDLAVLLDRLDLWRV